MHVIHIFNLTIKLNPMGMHFISIFYGICVSMLFACDEQIINYHVIYDHVPLDKKNKNN